MAPVYTRAERSRRTRTRLPRDDTREEDENDEGGAECPVCMNALGPRTFAFPCGHCVCSECDVKLRERSFYSCPTCREPRAGMSRAQVDAAATARVQRDQLSDQASDSWPFGSVEHNGSVYSVVFLPNESDGATPFDVLRTVPGRGTIRGRTLGRVIHRDNGQPMIDLTGDDEHAMEMEHPPVPSRTVRRAEVALPAPLAAMVAEMLQPTHLPDWLRRHDALAAMATSGDALPRRQARQPA